MYFDV
jgi:hypothetical protein